MRSTDLRAHGRADRGARWREFDLQAAEWRIPAERMKMHTPRIVPRSRQAIAVLATLAERRQGITGLLFPGERDHDVSGPAMLAADQHGG